MCAQETFYNIKSVRNKSEYNKVVEKELADDNYLQVILKGVQQNARLAYPEHQVCGFTSDSCTEKRLCHCLVRYDENNVECKTCPLKVNPFFAKKIKNAKMLEYEIAASNKKGDGVGGVDLLMEYDGKKYCAEFKPFWNKESILRMATEIITYTHVLEGAKDEFVKKYGEYEKAIMFTYGSEQWKQWTDKKYAHTACQRLRDIIEKESISVFCLTIEKDEYVVEKLN